MRTNPAVVTALLVSTIALPVLIGAFLTAGGATGSGSIGGTAG